MKRKLIFAALVAGVLTFAFTINVQAKEAKYIDTDELQEICEEVGEEFGICPELLQALVERESSGNIFAVNGDCKGLTQISERWHEERMGRLGVTDLFDPKGNIRVCADYLLELRSKNDDLYWVLMHYNMKHKTASRLYEAGQYTEYAIGICERAAQLEREHGK